MESVKFDAAGYLFTYLVAGKCIFLTEVSQTFNQSLLSSQIDSICNCIGFSFLFVSHPYPHFQVSSWHTLHLSSFQMNCEWILSSYFFFSEHLHIHLVLEFEGFIYILFVCFHKWMYNFLKLRSIFNTMFSMDMSKPVRISLLL